jgi:hypothetical protein
MLLQSFDVWCSQSIGISLLVVYAILLLAFRTTQLTYCAGMPLASALSHSAGFTKFVES